MRLDSVQGLKRELLNDLIIPLSEHALLALSLFGIGAKAVSTVPALQRTIALGVAPHKKGYRLAVRVQRPSLLHGPTMERLTREARGEVEVRLIGRVDKRLRARRVTAVVAAQRNVSAHRAPWHQLNVRPLLIGASIGHVRVTAGTIGAFVKRDSGIYVLSNNHVLANEDEATRGDWIVQRGTIDGGRKADRVARLGPWVKLKSRGANIVDAALAKLETGIGFDASRLRGISGGRDRRLAGLGPEVIDEGDAVFKIGRTTGVRRGRVTAFDLDNVVVNYDGGNLRFDNQIEIEGAGPFAFSDGGDSGALIVNARMQAVALLFAGGDSGGSNGMGLTYANPLHQVLKALRATLLFRR
jgi:hypothetical protein